jgi:uncharacterized membrane protein YdbT with pleckstrin-like domain
MTKIAGGQKAAEPDVRRRRPAATDDEERFLWEEHPSLRTVVPPLVGLSSLYLVLAIAAAVIPAGNAAAGGKGLGAMLQWPLFVVYVLLAVAYFCMSIYRLKSVRYRLSSQRIFVERGILNKRTDEIELEQYKDIFVKQGLWDRLMGCGDIEVISSDEISPNVVIVDVMNPIAKKDMIRNAARDRKQALGIVRREEI